RNTHFLWPATRNIVRLPGNAHQTAHGLNQGIVAGSSGIRAALPKAGNRTIDQARIDLRKRVVIQTVFFQAAYLVVLDQDIGFFDKLKQPASAGIDSKVESDGTLAPVTTKELSSIARHAVWIGGKRRPPTPGVVACAGTLYLDDIGAKSRQVLGRPGARQNSGQGQYNDVLQGCCHDAIDPISSFRSPAVRSPVVCFGCDGI